MSSLDDKTFILGVGAQKGGTSWLFKYFDDRDDTYMSPIKELHYFDCKHRPELCGPIQYRFVEQLLQRVREGRADRFEKDTQLRALVDRVSMIYDDTAYRRYFEDRVPETEEITHFGEITPSYSVLNEEGFADARSQFKKVRAILLLRDPIQRHYSLMKMKEKKGKIESAHDSFLEMLNNPGPAERGLYNETIENLEKVFKPEELYITFYEGLFRDEELRKICDFVGLPFIPGQYQKRVNAAGSASANKPLTEEQIAAGRERFAEVYDYCRDRFGDAIPGKWHL